MTVIRTRPRVQMAATPTLLFALLLVMQTRLSVFSKTTQESSRMAQIFAQPSIRRNPIRQIWSR